MNDAYGPIFLCLVSSWGKPISLVEIADFLTLSTKQCEGILKQLCDAGLLQKNGEYFQASQNIFKVPDSFANKKLKAFYAFWLNQSANALDLPVQLRRFRSLQLALSADEFERVTVEFNDFVVNLLSRYEHNTLEARSLYLMNTALFPVGRLPEVDL